MKATIKQIIRETPRVLSFRVVPEQPVSFKTGQAMRWNIPNASVGRLFSVASPGGQDRQELLFTIRIFPDGKLTSRLPELREGDTIELLGPYGNFTFNEDDPRDVGLVAGGSGISVLRSILRHILDRKLPRKVHLLFSVLNVDEIIYKDELAALAAQHDSFTYTIVVTEPHPNWTGCTGYVTKELFDQEFQNYQEQFYVCGPQAFIDCSVTILKDAGVPDERIHIDHWTFYPTEVKQSAR